MRAVRTITSAHHISQKRLCYCILILILILILIHLLRLNFVFNYAKPRLIFPKWQWLLPTPTASSSSSSSFSALPTPSPARGNSSSPTPGSPPCTPPSPISTPSSSLTEPTLAPPACPCPAVSPAATTPSTPILKRDCYAHSVLLRLSDFSLRPLTILTDAWCSSGQFLPNGTLLQTGGDLDGYRKIRKFVLCDETIDSSCDWVELSDVELAEGRWYGTNQILPNGRVIIVGGRGANTVEFFPPSPLAAAAVEFPFLVETEDKQMDNLYPYVINKFS